MRRVFRYLVILFPDTETSDENPIAAAKFLKVETMARKLRPPGPPQSAQVSQLEDLGLLVRNRRLALELRIDDAAHACGVSPSVMSRLENGGAIGADRLLLVLAGLGLTMLVTTREIAISARQSWLCDDDDSPAERQP